MTDPASDPISVREQLFLVAHDERRGMKPRLHPPSLAIGLAGATVIDLLIAERVAVARGQVVPDLYLQDPTGDPITDDVLRNIKQTVPRPSLDDVLRAAGPGLYERTRAALVHRGVVVEVPRRLGRKQYAIADEAVTVRVRARITYRAQGRNAPSPQADSMCALIEALGLHEYLYLGTRSEVSRMLRQVIDTFPENARAGRPPESPVHPLIAAPEVAGAVRGIVQDLATSAF